MNPVTLAQAIPAKARKWIYFALGTLIPLEQVVDVVPSNVEAKLLAVLVVLGFGTAFVNVSNPNKQA
jgi:hypothetical protein